MTADLDLVRRLARADHGLAVVAVARPDGSVHASLVNAGVLDASAALALGAGATTPGGPAAPSRPAPSAAPPSAAPPSAAPPTGGPLAPSAVAGGPGIEPAARGLPGSAAPGGPGPWVAFVAAGASRKLGLLERQGRATVVFRAGWEWVSVEGPVQLIGPGRTGLPALLRAIFTAAGGSHDDWDTFDRVMAEEGRVAVLVTPERIISNG